jgi:hypothetical protein
VAGFGREVAPDKNLVVPGDDYLILFGVQFF